MPVLLDTDFSAPEQPGCIHIGLINNMPDAALQAAERQFAVLLDSAAGPMDVRLSLYSLPEIRREGIAHRHLMRCYSGVEKMWERKLDGLIVTGTEPLASNMAEEGYWKSLTKVIDWAEQNTSSSIWSCLAAHAAVQHMDGITRRKLEEKCFGVFECTTASCHPLTLGTPTRFPMPHSRWNELRESDLTRHGYQILTHAGDGRVDAFVKRRKSLFLFFQGHPEYETKTLLLEYRRDLARYLRKERDSHPKIPQGYTGENPASEWRPASTQIYRNWLLYLRSQQNRSASCALDSSGAQPQMERECETPFLLDWH